MPIEKDNLKRIIIKEFEKDYPLDGYKTIAPGVWRVDNRVLWSDAFLCTDPM